MRTKDYRYLALKLFHPLKQLLALITTVFLVLIQLNISANQLTDIQTITSNDQKTVLRLHFATKPSSMPEIQTEQGFITVVFYQLTIPESKQPKHNQHKHIKLIEIKPSQWGAVLEVTFNNLLADTASLASYYMTDNFIDITINSPAAPKFLAAQMANTSLLTSTQPATNNILIKVLVYLLILIAGAYLILKIYQKRFAIGTRNGPKTKVIIQDIVPINAKQKIWLVGVGPKNYAIHINQNNVQLITELEDDNKIIIDELANTKGYAAASIKATMSNRSAPDNNHKNWQQTHDQKTFKNELLSRIKKLKALR